MESLIWHPGCLADEWFCAAYVQKTAAFLQDSRVDVDHAKEVEHREVRDEIKDLGLGQCQGSDAVTTN